MCTMNSTNDETKAQYRACFLLKGTVELVSNFNVNVDLVSDQVYL